MIGSDLTVLALYISLLETAEQKDKFEFIYYQYRGFMYYIAFGLMKDQYLAEDVVHETFLNLIRIIDNVRTSSEKELMNFLKTLTRHQAINMLHKLNRYEKADESLTENISMNAKNDPETIAIDRIDFEDLLERVQNMSETYRSTLILKIQGYKIDEIANILNTTPSNVKVRLHRARRILLHELTETNGGIEHG